MESSNETPPRSALVRTMKVLALEILELRKGQIAQWHNDGEKRRMSCSQQWTRRNLFQSHNRIIRKYGNDR